MVRWLGVVVVVAAAGACSSSAGSSSSSSSGGGSSSSGAPCCANGTGLLGGERGFTPVYVRHGTGINNDGGVDPTWREVLLSNNGQCTGEGHFSTLLDVRVNVSRWDGQAVVPGSYPITWVDYTWPNDGGTGGPHGESCVVTFQQYSTADGGVSLRAHTGHVELTAVSDDHMVGTFDVALDPADGGATQTLTGSFDAPLCNAGARASSP